MKKTVFWLAYPQTPRGGIDRVIDEINALQIDAVLSVRIGQAGRIENGCDEPFVAKVLQRLGADRVEIWWGSHPTTWAEELHLAMQYHRLGVRRFAINAETAWKFSGSNAVAEKYSGEALRLLPDSRVSHAPFALMQSHAAGNFPYLGFAKLHAAYLQWYPNEFGGNRAYWAKRYADERRAFVSANPSMQHQEIITMGDIYGADFGKSWGLRPAPGVWADSHLDSQLALSDQFAESEIAFYSVDAALSETERTSGRSAPWQAVRRWAGGVAQKNLDEAHKKYCSETLQQCIDPDVIQSCFDFASHAVEAVK